MSCLYPTAEISIDMTDFKYVGSELDLFAAVVNWKSYWSGRIRSYITGDVLEVGAGSGTNTDFMDHHRRGRWVCLEPDAKLVEQLTVKVIRDGNSSAREVLCGTLASIDVAQSFDTIIYIDVLEHIEHDEIELQLATSHLRRGGRIIVLAPAHQKLFTSFDAAIGHYRRYDRGMMRRISVPGLSLERLFYLDSAGLALSAANLLLLRQSMPTHLQLAIWDKCVIPVSRILDKLLLESVGKSIIAVWHKES